jgi:hypothetical protein
MIVIISISPQSQISLFLVTSCVKEMDSETKVYPFPDKPHQEQRERIQNIENTDYSEYQTIVFKGIHFGGHIYDDGSTPAPKTIGVVGAIRDILTCKFLVYGDTARDIRGQMIQEQLNIALVAALFLTVSIPAMLWSTELYQHGWTETESSVFGLSLCIATANFAIAVVLAVFFSLSIQECIDDAELRRFARKMGRYLQLSSVSFIAGVITIGAFTWTTWCYVTFESTWFWGIFGGCIVLNTFVAVLGGLITMIKNLYAAKEGRHGLLIVHKAELTKAVVTFLKSLPSPDLGSLESMREFLLRESCCTGLTEMTGLRLKSIWKQELQRELKEEYEDPYKGESGEEDQT